jgi:hypothetical protein
MTKKEIIFDWLAQKENRDKLPVTELNKNEFQSLEAYGHIYKYEEDEVGCIGKQYFRIVKK